MTAKTSSVNGEGIYEPFNIDVVPWENHAPNQQYAIKFQELAKFGGATRVGVSLEILPSGKRSNPAHYHMLEEEHLLVLEGKLTLRLGEKNFEMGAGHYACFPAGQKVGHSLFNHTAESCRYLIIGDRNPHDVIVYTDSGRVSVRLTGEGYRKSAVMDYWEGEKLQAPASDTSA